MDPAKASGEPRYAVWAHLVKWRQMATVTEPRGLGPGLGAGDDQRAG